MTQIFNDGDILVHNLGDGSLWVRHNGGWINPSHITLDGEYLGSTYDDQWAWDVTVVHGYGKCLAL